MKRAVELVNEWVKGENYTSKKELTFEFVKEFVKHAKGSLLKTKQAWLSELSEAFHSKNSKVMDFKLVEREKEKGLLSTQELLGLSPKVLAEQIALLEQHLFCNISMHELVFAENSVSSTIVTSSNSSSNSFDSALSGEQNNFTQPSPFSQSPPPSSPHLFLFLKTMQEFQNWVVTCILFAGYETRNFVYQFFADLLNELVEIGEYNAAHSVLQALNRKQVKALLKNQLISPLNKTRKNYLLNAQKKLSTEYISVYGQHLNDLSPCIPLLSSHLDLLQTLSQFPSFLSHPSNPSANFINWEEKMVPISLLLNDLSKLQSNKYHFQVKKEVLHSLLCVKASSEKQIESMLQTILYGGDQGVRKGGEYKERGRSGVAHKLKYTPSTTFFER